MPRKKAPKKLPRPRRPRGTGTLFLDQRRGVWVARAHGREFRSPDRDKAAGWLRTAAPPDPGEGVTVGEWCDRWLAALTVKEGSRKAYRIRVEERIRPALGAVRLDRLTAWDVESAAAGWAGAPNTIRATLATLAAILQAARRARLIGENVAALARKPAAPEKRFDLFDRAELRAVFDAGLSRPEWGTFAVLAGTGCRIGEALALRPDDFDAPGLRLSVARTWTAGGEGTPKSRHSRRTVAVPPELAPVLAAGPPRVSYATAKHHWVALLRALGLRFRRIHQVRHSFASHALADGVPVADLAAHLGHTPAELLKTYSHPTGADMGAAARRVLGLGAGPNPAP